VVYAASSASYGDDDAPAKAEQRVGRVLSPYAASKSANELWAQSYAAAYGMTTVGLRYFNIFGPRQDPRGAYAAVIPAWVEAATRGEAATIHGNGLQTRDFAHVANVLAANLLAATGPAQHVTGAVVNVGTGVGTDLRTLHAAIAEALEQALGVQAPAAIFGPPRPGDVQHSRADLNMARLVLGYQPLVGLDAGLKSMLTAAAR